MIWSTFRFNDKTSDETQIKPTAIIKKPFLKASGVTQFLRLAWSPNGQFIMSAHASNNTAPVSKLIERNSWNCENDCVGHRAAICSVSFNPNLYSNSDDYLNDINVFVAFGGRDGTISVWNLPKNRPVCVLHNFFVSSVADMAWSYDGKTLIMSSVEGNISFLNFDIQEEFGFKQLNQKEKFDYHQKLYGVNVSTAFQIPKIPLSIDFMKNDNENEFKENVMNGLDETNNNIEFNKIQDEIINNKEDNFEKNDQIQQKEIQKETIMKDGRKRITPILIAAPMDESPETKTKENGEFMTIHRKKKGKR